MTLPDPLLAVTFAPSCRPLTQIPSMEKSEKGRKSRRTAAVEPPPPLLPAASGFKEGKERWTEVDDGGPDIRTLL